MQRYHSEAGRNQENKAGMLFPLSQSCRTKPTKSYRRPAGEPLENVLTAALSPIPLTHAVAGADVPVTEKLKTPCGLSEQLFDDCFFSEISKVKKLVLWAISRGYLDKTKAIAALSSTNKTFLEQATVVKEVKDEILDNLALHLHQSVADMLPFVDLSAGSLFECRDWETQFSIYDGALSSEREWVNALCFYHEDFDKEDQFDILQLIAFCGELGHHSTSIGEAANNSLEAYGYSFAVFMSGVEEESLGCLLSDLKGNKDIDESLHRFIERTHRYEADEWWEWWEWWRESMDHNYLINGHRENLLGLIESHQEVDALSKKLKPLSRESLDAYLARIESRGKQDWLMLAAEALVKNAKLFDNRYSHISYQGEADHELLAPILLNFQHEENMFNGLNEMVASCCETGGISIELNDFTFDVLTNFHLAESLLCYAKKQTDKSD